MADRFSYSCRRSSHTEISHTSSNLSFSSTLLEEICRSIDRGGDDDIAAICSVDSMRKKRDDGGSATAPFPFKTDEEMANYQRACMIEKWMEKKAVGRVKSLADLQEKDRLYSSSSSSDSSCGGGFFSSEPESFPFRQPKPVRTGKLGFEKGRNCDDSMINRRNRRGFCDELEQKTKNESRFVKTKSKALKIYGDLKKVKQPISPGGKVAAFLNSLFAAGNLKKPKIAAACGDDVSPSLKSSTTACSSASSFSRSCLSKTTTSSSSSEAKSAGSAKRSVRFFPVSAIVDEDRHKSLRQSSNDDDLIDAAIDEELAMHVRKKDQIGREFEHSFDIFSRIRDRNRSFDREFDDEFDGASCASSDLFELENLSAIGLEELPVYETTHLEKIQTVANGLIL
ncbi:hypothetical protein C2S51_018420 [Perilla frutescens var. frutescens]|nr:hypothetical protein C2S51_018420 [Perilla frutescens var. frutescens]